MRQDTGDYRVKNSDQIDSLLVMADALEQRMSKIQMDQHITLSAEGLRSLHRDYQDWYAQAFDCLTDEAQVQFRKCYEGTLMSPKIREFLNGPDKPSAFYASMRESSPSVQVDYWSLPYKRVAHGQLLQQMLLLRLAKAVTIRSAQSQAPSLVPASDVVFVVHGRNSHHRRDIVDTMRAAGIRPLEFEQARQLTGEASPFIGTILDHAFRVAQAIVVIFSDDEDVRLREHVRAANGEDDSGFQPRPNVILEAGMALALHPTRTVIVEMGNIRPISDLAGRHVVRWDGSPRARLAFLQRLETAKCAVDYSGADWLEDR